MSSFQTVKPQKPKAYLTFLYHTAPGRCCLKLLTAPFLSKLAGRFLDSSVSRLLISPFRKKYGIDLSEYEPEEYRSFNAFFSRQIRKECRPVNREADVLIAPCDAFLTAVPMEKNRVLAVKQAAYTLESLLRDPALAAEFTDGLCLIFRLSVHHYHRYCYFDSAVRGETVHLPGVLHTVQPAALEQIPVFQENTREYTVLETETFGRAIQMEVGAMLVGKIDNLPAASTVVRGEEKGKFLYGGSTILVLLRKDAAEIDETIRQASARGEETMVKMGEAIGRKAAAGNGKSPAAGETRERKTAAETGE